MVNAAGPAGSGEGSCSSASREASGLTVDSLGEARPAQLGDSHTTPIKMAYTPEQTVLRVAVCPGVRLSGSQPQSLSPASVPDAG